MYLLNPNPLLVTRPQIQKLADGREPEPLLVHAQLYRSIVVEPGKKLRRVVRTGAVYPADAFFGGSASPSLTTCRAVPRIIASVMALL